MQNEIEVIEEMLLNSIPAMRTVLLDGWVIRMNRNYTYRANCVCPLYGTMDGAAEKIGRCEKLFGRNRLPSVFKVTPALQENLSGLLQSMNYRKIKTVNAMCCVLRNSDGNLASDVQCSEIPDPDWLAVSAKLTGVADPDLVLIHCRGISGIAVRSVFVKAARDGKTVGCGYGTVEREHVGIYDLHVDQDYRHCGIGTSICRAILQYGGEHGAKIAYLIVHAENQNAIRIYSHMGFSPLYDYSFYQKENSEYRIIDA